MRDGRTDGQRTTELAPRRAPPTPRAQGWNNAVGPREAPHSDDDEDDRSKEKFRAAQAA